MERLRVIEGLREDAANGGIITGHKDLERATSAYRAAVTVYNEAESNLIEAALPRHYRLVIWGSARLDPSTKEYAFTRDLAESLVARTGCDIVTGGGPGIMEAAPEGALRARASEGEGPKSTSRNYGIRIKLPFEEEVSARLDQHTKHDRFSTRLDEFLAISHGVIVAPGGIGSALELLMALQLRQVGHLEDNYPIIVHPYWEKILDAMRKTMYDDRIKEGQKPLVSEGDMDKIVISDDIPEIVNIFAEHKGWWKENIHAKVIRQKQQKLF